jgi:hypothetical protein
MHINKPAVSKINWTQFLAMGATVIAATNPQLIPLIDAAQSPEVQAAAVAGVAAVGQVATVIFRTWFTEK